MQRCIYMYKYVCMNVHVCMYIDVYICVHARVRISIAKGCIRIINLIEKFY